MSKLIIVDNGDGSVGVIIPANCGLTVEAIAAKDCEGKQYKIIDSSSLPSDRYFREAWVVSSTGVKIDMVKARNVHLSKIRIERDKKFSGLDIAYQVADEQNDVAKKTAIAEQKQFLRDLPASVDLSGAKTPDELKAIWPEILS